MPILVIDGPNAAYLGQGGLILGMPMHDPHAETTFLPAGGTALPDHRRPGRGPARPARREPGEAAYRCQDAGSAEVEVFINHLMSIFGARGRRRRHGRGAKNQLGPIESGLAAPAPPTRRSRTEAAVAAGSCILRLVVHYLLSASTRRSMSSSLLPFLGRSRLASRWLSSALVRPS